MPHLSLWPAKEPWGLVMKVQLYRDGHNQRRIWVSRHWTTYDGKNQPFQLKRFLKIFYIVVAAAEYSSLLREDRSCLKEWLEEDVVRGGLESDKVD